MSQSLEETNINNNS